MHLSGNSIEVNEARIGQFITIENYFEERGKVGEEFHVFVTEGGTSNDELLKLREA